MAMNKQDLKKYKLPDEPGVYIFCGKRKRILYIGKATDLRSRVRSYFGKDLLKSRGPLLVKMLEEAKSVTWEETDSVLEALILEANLIKKHQPPYNTKEKSDKSFNYVVITKEDFPRVLIVRESELLRSSTPKFGVKFMFGPFTSGGLLKEALKIVRKMFPYRDSCRVCPRRNLGQTVRKPCFNRQIGLCPGVCSGEINRKDYARTIRNIILLFRGKKKILIQKLNSEMKKTAKTENFEQATTLRNNIFALEHINDISLIKDESKTIGESSLRIEAYDVAHISETARVGVMVVVQDGKATKSRYRKFKIKTRVKGDVAALKEILERRMAHNDWVLPELIVVDGGKAQMNVTKNVLKEFGYKIPIVTVVKDERHKPKQILSASNAKYNEKEVLLANSEAHRFAVAFHRQKRDKIR